MCTVFFHRGNDRFGQRFFIYLAVLVQRNLINLHDGCRNHIRRLSGSDIFGNFLCLNLFLRYVISGDGLAVGT